MKKIILLAALFLGITAGIAQAAPATETTTVTFTGPQSPLVSILVVNFTGSDGSTLFLSKELVMNDTIANPVVVNSALKVISGSVSVPNFSGKIQLPANCLIDLKKVRNFNIQLTQNSNGLPALTCSSN